MKIEASNFQNSDVEKFNLQRPDLQSKRLRVQTKNIQNDQNSTRDIRFFHHIDTYIYSTRRGTTYAGHPFFIILIFLYV